MLPSIPQWNQPIVDPKTGVMTPEFQRFLQALLAAAAAGGL